MGNVSHGPSIVTDGLVLCLDNYNEQSYLGEPTTNLVPNGDFVSYTGGLPTGWTGYNSNAMMTAVTTDLPNGKMGLVMQAGPIWPTDSVCGVQVILGARTSGQTETISFWYRMLNTTSTSSNFWCGTWNYPDTRDVYFSSSTNTTWTYFSKQITWNTDNSTRYYRFLTDQNNLTGTGFTMQLYQVQFETNSQATKFVNGTRSATDGWQDLSGNNNHADLTQLSYSATNVPGTNVNEFSFDGTDDKIVGSDVGNAMRFTSSFSIDAWFKIDTNLRSPIFDYYTYGLDWQPASSQVGIWYKSENSWDNEYCDTYPLSVNTWYHAVGVYNHGGNLQIYINGSLDGQSSALPISTSYSWNGPNIGYTTHVGGVWTDGEIPTVKVYNRALSAAEVLRNYNANKGRYGL